MLDKLPGFEEMILKDYRVKTEAEYPCGYLEDCIKSDPWMIDSDYDGHPEIVFLIRSPVYIGSDWEKYYNIFLAKLTKTGELVCYNLHKINVPCCDAFVDILGFLGTRDKHTHLLINFAYPGTGTGYPMLKIFDILPTNVQKIGEFAGFYEHAIADRLKDIDGDGNTEIIYVKDTYRPPGKSNAYIMPIYGIAEYRDGRIVNANEKFKKDIERLNEPSELNR